MASALYLYLAVDPHLYAGFRERRFRGETLARGHTRIMRSLEFLLELLELLRTESRAVAPELWLLRTVQATVISVAICTSIETRFHGLRISEYNNPIIIINILLPNERFVICSIISK